MLKIEDTADGIRCIGLNRPDKRNAIGVEMTFALEDVLLKTKTESMVKAIVFHGLGGHFCAGMDMKDFFEGVGEGHSAGVWEDVPVDRPEFRKKYAGMLAAKATAYPPVSRCTPLGLPVVPEV